MHPCPPSKEALGAKAHRSSPMTVRLGNETGANAYTLSLLFPSTAYLGELFIVSNFKAPPVKLFYNASGAVGMQSSGVYHS